MPLRSRTPPLGASGMGKFCRFGRGGAASVAASSTWLRRQHATSDCAAKSESGLVAVGAPTRPQVEGDVRADGQQQH